MTTSERKTIFTESSVVRSDGFRAQLFFENRFRKLHTYNPQCIHNRICLTARLVFILWRHNWERLPFLNERDLWKLLSCKKKEIRHKVHRHRNLPISTKRLRTLRDVLAEVSKKMISFSWAYCCASSVWTFRLLSMSALFPARAMTTLGSPRLCSSFTHDLAPLNES